MEASPNPAGPAGEPTLGLADEIASLAAHLDAATHRLLTCIRRFDEVGGWCQQGALSCAHWLTWRINLDPGAAREKVRVARALASLPKIDDALRRGVLSYAKVRALTRVATPDNEGRLLEMALYTTGAQLERLCRQVRRVAGETGDDAQGERPDDLRYVHDKVLPNGLVRLTAVLHADEAAIVLKAIEAARRLPAPESEATAVPRSAAAADVSAETPPMGGPPAEMPPAADVSAEAPPAETPPAEPPPAATPSAEPLPAGAPPGDTRPRPLLARTDALVRVSEAFLAHGDAAGAGGDRTQIFLHVDQDPLAPDGTLAATLDDGTRVSAETFRRLACDAALVTVAHASGGRAALSSRTRTIPPALRRALHLRDRGCRFPGCTNRLYVHAHHIHQWAHGGATTADNLLLLCSAHHRLIHEGGLHVERNADDDIVFLDRHRRPIPAAAPAWPMNADATEVIAAWNASHGLDICPDTNLNGWDGDPVDYDGATEAVLWG